MGGNHLRLIQTLSVQQENKESRTMRELKGKSFDTMPPSNGSFRWGLCLHTMVRVNALSPERVSILVRDRGKRKAMTAKEEQKNFSDSGHQRKKSNKI